jgi:hypothetical protein
LRLDGRKSFRPKPAEKEQKKEGRREQLKRNQAQVPIYKQIIKLYQRPFKALVVGSSPTQPNFQHDRGQHGADILGRKLIRRGSMKIALSVKNYTNLPSTLYSAPL